MSVANSRSGSQVVARASAQAKTTAVARVSAAVRFIAAPPDPCATSRPPNVDSAIVELPGLAVDIGVAASERAESGILYHSLLAPLSAGVAERFLADYVATTPPRAELRFHRGEHIVLIWYAHTSGEAVRCFVRFEVDVDSERIALVREYYHSPEALAELATELSVPYRSNGYGG